MKVLYHYTNEAGYTGILASGELRPSNPVLNGLRRDATYGFGWYFTDLDPSYCDVCIAEACWENYKSVTKVTHYFAFEAHDDVPERGRSWVYVVREWIQEKIRLLTHGRKDSLRCDRHKGQTEVR